MKYNGQVRPFHYVFTSCTSRDRSIERILARLHLLTHLCVQETQTDSISVLIYICFSEAEFKQHLASRTERFRAVVNLGANVS